MSDDEIIGLKSTSIRFKKNIKKFIFLSYLITAIVVLFLFKNIIGMNLFSFLLLLFISSLFYQLLNLNENSSKSCLKMFKFNNYSGLLLFVTILSINL